MSVARNLIRTKPVLSAFAATAVLLASGTTAIAAGGGGGGGSVSPSQSAPRYDPAEEYRQGVEALNQEQFETAAKHFRRVTKVSKRDPNSHYLLGVSYMRGGDAKKARKPLEKAVKYAPDLLAAQRDLAIVYMSLERSDDANAVLAGLKQKQAACAGNCQEKASLDAIVAEVESALGGKQLSRFGPSETLLTKVAEGDARYGQAIGLINEGKYELALISLKDAGIAFGPHPDVLTYQGFANRKLGRFDKAEAYYQRALGVAPDHLGALEYYGELKVERGDIDGARSHLARLDELCAFGCHEAEELRSWIANRTS
ncbi:tetratricopeptide repeat protein [uncultured Erythrobacter sp.]|uniref:tetratricopeptide repeat protein n=1 Tax=uncultured Erythrobacter sp. TaxID=263913 RepID=UPI00261D19F7|nr:tetratricopeptide repeat protein [uncultured Erythrobacter sp.]